LARKANQPVLLIGRCDWELSPIPHPNPRTNRLCSRARLFRIRIGAIGL